MFVSLWLLTNQVHLQANKNKLFGKNKMTSSEILSWKKFEIVTFTPYISGFHCRIMVLIQWRSQGLPGWASYPPRMKTKMRKKMKKNWGKMRENTWKRRKIEEIFLSCPPGVERLATALSWFELYVEKKRHLLIMRLIKGRVMGPLLVRMFAPVLGKM